MYKYLFLFLIFFFLNSCSVDTKSGFWENKNIPHKDNKLANISFDELLSYEDFKKNVIEYGKLSNFPKLDKNENKN